MADARVLDIGEVARRSGFSVSTLRYYEDKGLIASVGRHGLHRLFDSKVLLQLTLISLGRSASFTLDEIAAMFGSDGEPRIDRAALLAKATDLDDAIKRLTSMRDGLRHTAACTAANHLSCPTFQRILRVTAARGPSQRRTRGEPLRLKGLSSIARGRGPDRDGVRPRDG